MFGSSLNTGTQTLISCLRSRMLVGHHRVLRPERKFCQPRLKRAQPGQKPRHEYDEVTVRHLKPGLAQIRAGLARGEQFGVSIKSASLDNPPGNGVGRIVLK